MKIYLTAYPLNSGSGAVHGSTPGGDVLGCALAEDGIVVAQHLSSSVGFARHDLGLESDWQHERYRAHAPAGFELEWVEWSERNIHPGWLAAMERNRTIAKD